MMQIDVRSVTLPPFFTLLLLVGNLSAYGISISGREYTHGIHKLEKHIQVCVVFISLLIYKWIRPMYFIRHVDCIHVEKILF